MHACFTDAYNVDPYAENAEALCQATLLALQCVHNPPVKGPQNLPKLAARTRYHTPAADLYRRQLQALAGGCLAPFFCGSSGRYPEILESILDPPSAIIR